VLAQSVCSQRAARNCTFVAVEKRNEQRVSANSERAGRNYRTHKMCESVCTNKAVTGTCVFGLKTWGGGGAAWGPWKRSNSGQTSAVRNSGTVANVGELVTGGRRVTAGRGFVKMGNEDLHQVCSHSPKNKLSGGVRPATLFTWPHTNRLFTIPWNKTRPQTDFRSSRASRRT